MHHVLTRRAFVGAGTSLVLVSASGAGASRPDAEKELAALEQARGGRLGVAALDLESGRRVHHRADERFAMCSTFKTLAAAFVLARVDRGLERLDRTLPVSRSDIITHSPIVETRVGSTITIAELCHATITVSDNAAANLLLAGFGGPAALTEFLRTTGDTTTRLDRNEPDLNEAKAGDPRDTTTPLAMLETTNRLALGDVLSPASRQLLQDWLVATTTGGKRIRAGLPAGWRVGDKTGTGKNGATNDVAIAWPPGRKPVLVTVYYAEAEIPAEDRNTVIADAARIVAAAL